MYFHDKVLQCKDCEQDFFFTAGEQDFYAQKGLVNEPRRCPDCRNKRKQRAMEEGRAEAEAAAALRQFTTITCADCGKQTTVPFQPKLSRPLYCRECYVKFKTAQKSEEKSEESVAVAQGETEKAE